MKFIITLICICLVTCVLSAGNEDDADTGEKSFSNSPTTLSTSSSTLSSTAGNVSSSSPTTISTSSATLSSTTEKVSSSSSTTLSTSSSSLSSTAGKVSSSSPTTLSTSSSTLSSTAGNVSSSSSTTLSTSSSTLSSTTEKESSSSSTTHSSGTSTLTTSIVSPALRSSTLYITADGNGSSTTVSTASSSPGMNITDGSTVDSNESSTHEATDNDTIIIYSSPLDKNSTNGTDSTTPYLKTTTAITTTVGDEKESNKSLCFNNPCKNGGTCKEISIPLPYVACECPLGYTGLLCGTVDKCVNDSDGVVCKNGSCVFTTDMTESFCTCFGRYYWDDSTNECKRIMSVCDSSPCKNGGECIVLSGDKYNCSCGAGFSGKTCEITQHCVTNSDCGHGVCILSDDQTTRSCKCDEGYHAQFEPHTCVVTNTSCDTKPCKNGGVCNVLKGTALQYNCTCETGFSGETCEIVDLCATKEDCGNGSCILSEDKKTRSCNCSSGFYLDKPSHTCKKISNVCEPNPCMYDGICTVLSSTDFNCTCSDGTNGKKCELRDMCYLDGGHNFCIGSICQNNYELGIYYCTCPPDQYFQYTERKCTEVDLCPLMQCESNQKCLDGACICKENYKNSTGKCEPDFCSKKPCPVPDMLCEEGTGATDYKCTCEEGYTFNGTHCNEALCVFPKLNPCQQHCKVVDGGYQCSCDEDFNLREDNKTCELKGNNTCNVKVCDKGSCVLKSNKEVCICPPGYIEVDGNCTDKCSATKLTPGFCPNGCELTKEGGFRCKCQGKFAYAEDQITCVVRNMCQENEAGWKKCSERNAKCLQNWNKTEGFECRCQTGQVETDDRICKDVCSVESNQKMCSLKDAVCAVDINGNATCKCPPYFQPNEKDGKCNKITDVSYSVTLPLDLSTYTMANRKRRSLDTSVNYMKISRDLKITLEDMFIGYKRSNVLHCSPASDYILCKIEIQFETMHETQLQRLESEEICLGNDGDKKCLLPPALVLVKERISSDVIIQPTDPCDDYIKDENCGSETTCTGSATTKDFNCTCKPGFSMRKRDYSFGGTSVVELCRDIDECTEDPCMENSICENTIGSYKCICMVGYRRELTNSNEVKCVEICSPNPCTHGLCTRRGDHEFDCKCDAGYRGALCDLQDENFKRERNNSIILGVVLGGILLITFILFAVCVSRLRKRKCMENPGQMFYDATEMKERGRINNAFQRE